MKILYLTTVPSPYKVDFFNELSKYCDLTVIYEMREESYRNSNWMKTDTGTQKTFFLKGPVIKNKKISFEILSYLLKEKYDFIIVGVYSTIPELIAQLYMKLNNIPYIISSDGGMVKSESKISYLIKRYFIGSANAWLSTGKITTEYLCHYGANCLKTHVYPFTSLKKLDIINANLSSDTEKKKIRAKLGIAEDRVILTVGRFSYKGGYGKGYDVLLKATEQLSGDFGIYIVGDDPTDEFIKWKDEHMLNNVHYVGFKSKDDLAEYYAAADIFTLLTRGDVWGLVINEAMTYGLPIVTTDKCVAGIELVKDGENGFIVGVGDGTNTVKALQKLITSSELCQVMGRKSLKKIQVYNIENMAKTHIDILTKLKRSK